MPKTLPTPTPSYPLLRSPLLQSGSEMAMSPNGMSPLRSVDSSRNMRNRQASGALAGSGEESGMFEGQESGMSSNMPNKKKAKNQKKKQQREWQVAKDKLMMGTKHSHMPLLEQQSLLDLKCVCVCVCVRACVWVGWRVGAVGDVA